MTHGPLLGLGRMQRKSTLKHRKIQKDEAAKACTTASPGLFLKKAFFVHVVQKREEELVELT